MPAIVITNLVSDLQEYLPSQNILTETQLTNIATNVVANQIPEDDDVYYSEALCKSLKVAGIRNNLSHVVDSGSLTKEEVGDVKYTYSADNHRDIWKTFLGSLSDLCPYLPGGGYNMPSAIGVGIYTKEVERDIVPCDDTNDLIL